MFLVIWNIACSISIDMTLLICFCSPNVVLCNERSSLHMDKFPTRGWRWEKNLPVEHSWVRGWWKVASLILVIKWQPMWTNMCLMWDTQGISPQAHLCEATHAMTVKMDWIYCKAPTCDEGAYCIWDMTWSHMARWRVEMATREGVNSHF